jgi:hypothetical protein
VGTINLPFNPAFLNIEEFDGEASLFITSFYNIYKEQGLFGRTRNVEFERDLVARIPDIDEMLTTGSFDEAIFEELTGRKETILPRAFQKKVVWPNDAVKVPEGVFPFAALLIPQGFLSASKPGRLTAIDMTSPERTEYIIDQSTWLKPRYYHTAIFYDVDGDGLLDIVTVRSGFYPTLVRFIPRGELVWFQNPGQGFGIAKGYIKWKERILYRTHLFRQEYGPDVALQAHDFDGDGVPEFVATHFFQEKISLFGAPCDGSECSWDKVGKWKIFNLRQENGGILGRYQPRVKELSSDQGKPFGIEIVDMNNDGKLDILITNHQNGLDCNEEEVVDGRVYVLDGTRTEADPFVATWATHILLDGIRPNPTLPDAPACRLAPGFALPLTAMSDDKPWITLAGDESSKFWLLKPASNMTGDWTYYSEIIFDINVFYGPGTTQTTLDDPAGITISTIGRHAVHTVAGATYILVPIFEAKQIQVFKIMF